MSLLGGGLLTEKGKESDLRVPQPSVALSIYHSSRTRTFLILTDYIFIHEPSYSSVNIVIWWMGDMIRLSLSPGILVR